MPSVAPKKGHCLKSQLVRTGDLETIIERLHKAFQLLAGSGPGIKSS